MRSATVSFMVVALVSLCAAVLGQTVPGEKWKQKITVSMEGMTMPMASQEICAPIGQTESLLKPDEDCTTSEVKVVGDTTSARVTCTGEDAMSGTVQLTATGNTVSGKAQMKTPDGEQMVLLMESTKIGPCQAMDVGAVAAKAKAEGDALVAAHGNLDACSSATAMIEKDPTKAGAMAQMFVEPGQPCAKKPANPVFCTALQTRGGFSALVSVEAYSQGITARSVTACGLGAGETGVDALRQLLVRTAEADGDGDFIIAQAPDRARKLSLSECVLKGEMWAGTTAKWDRFCDSNFAAASREGH